MMEGKIKINIVNKQTVKKSKKTTIYMEAMRNLENGIDFFKGMPTPFSKMLMFSVRR